MIAKKYFLASMLLMVSLILFSCCSSKSEESKNSQLGKMMYKNSIPPGSADIKATVTNFSEEKDF